MLLVAYTRSWFKKSNVIDGFCIRLIDKLEAELTFWTTLNCGSIQQLEVCIAASFYVVSAPMLEGAGWSVSA